MIQTSNTDIRTEEEREACAHLVELFAWRRVLASSLVSEIVAAIRDRAHAGEPQAITDEREACIKLIQLCLSTGGAVQANLLLPAIVSAVRTRGAIGSPVA
jgi:hypothetical protein